MSTEAETLAGTAPHPHRSKSATEAMPADSRLELRLARIERQLDLLVEHLITGPGLASRLLDMLGAAGSGIARAATTSATEIGATARSAIEQGAVKWLAGAAIAIAAMHYGIPLAMDSGGVTVGGGKSHAAQEAP